MSAGSGRTACVVSWLAMAWLGHFEVPSPEPRGRDGCMCCGELGGWSSQYLGAGV